MTFKWKRSTSGTIFFVKKWEKRKKKKPIKILSIKNQQIDPWSATNKCDMNQILSETIKNIIQQIVDQNIIAKSENDDMKNF